MEDRNDMEIGVLMEGSGLDTERMQENRMPERIMNGYMYETRKRSRRRQGPSNGRY